MSYLEQRVIRLENLATLQDGYISALQAGYRELQDAQSRQQLGGYGGGGGDGGKPKFYAISDGLGNAATGTWPTLTPYTFASDVYKFVGTTQTLVATGATINWPFKDAMSATAGKLVPCTLNDDGESYDADFEACTVVT